MDGWLSEWTEAEAMATTEPMPVWPDADPIADRDRLRAGAEAMRAEAIAGVLAGSTRLARRVFARVRRYQEERRTLAALRSLDDKTLKDIGLSRGNLMHVAACTAAGTPVRC